jgi:hypothetical protein
VFCSVARFFGRAILRLTGWQHKGGKQPEQEPAKQQFLARRFFSSLPSLLVDVVILLYVPIFDYPLWDISDAIAPSTK